MKNLLISLLILGSGFAMAQDYSRAPNSYIYDVDLADLGNYGGLLIPVKKAYRAWSDPSGFLNSPIPSGSQSAGLYWEDEPGLIRSVSISGSNEDAQIRVAIKKGMKGNAVVSLHVGPNGNTSDPIYWTWHVWVTDDPTNGIEYTKGFETDLQNERFDPKHMDRNLGAVSKYFLGNDWHKSAGLFYQWGRKDPFPPLLHKDRTYYELNGLVGNITNEDSFSPEGLHYTMKERPYNEAGSNIKYAVQHPIEYMIYTDDGNWFSNQALKSQNPAIAWDLWADNYRGGPSNANSSNQDVSEDSKSYEIKSVYDPCPGGWRVVSNYGREAVNNNLSPYGRGGGGNDDLYNDYVNGQFVLNPDVNNGKPLATIQHTVENPVLEGLKVYPKLGFDYSAVADRDLGMVSINGRFQLYKQNGSYSNAIYQDELADGGVWSATYGGSYPRFFYYIADTDQPDEGVGRYRVRINETSNTASGHGVRCIKDPNEDLIGFFSTNYISTPEYQEYTKGLDDPNSYLIDNTTTELRIPVSKAFSVYNQLLTDNDMLPDNNLKAKVFWTTNTQLIKKINISQASDPKNSEIVVEFNPDQTGNAVVSLHNENINNPAYWSWHIWAPASEIGTVTYTTEDVIPTPHHIVNLTKSTYPPLTTNFMDRNLGAIEKFPKVSNSDVTDPNEIAKIKESGGFHYQWGRKDPIPDFKKPGSNETYSIYKGTAVDANGYVTYQPITSADYESFYTEDYTYYAGMAGLQGSDDKYGAAKKVLKYSVQNPLTFLFHSGQGESYTAPNAIDASKIRDWISNSVGSEGDRSLMADRWGHGTKKSAFDPCPEGWRVPDYSVVLLRTSGKGTSPWYFGNDGGNGVDQRDYYNTESSYGGQKISVNGNRAGWQFDSEEFRIGSFPRTGIRGELGDDQVNLSTTGVWTAAMSDYMVGYALGMQLKPNGANDYMRTGTGVYPQAGMNVRCATDEARYTAGLNLSNEEITISGDEAIMVYPNPVSDYLNISSKLDFSYSIFNLSGQQLSSGKVKNQRIDFKYLPKGIYILVLNQSIVKKVIKR